MSVRVHQALPGDLEALIPLFDAYRQFYGQASDIQLARDFLQQRFARRESVAFLATDNADAALGFTQLYPVFSSVRARRVYTLNDLYVRPAARRRGVATQLLAQAADFARAEGAVRLSLSTALGNLHAQRLYESLGWKQDEAFRYYHLVL